MLTTVQKHIRGIGAYTLGMVAGTGRTTVLFVTCLSRIFARPFPWQEFTKQLYFIGAKSSLVVVVAGLFTGMVIALQFYNTLVRFGSVDLLGSAVALSLLREMGAVMTALMFIARVGSSVCAEIAIMRNEQQFDALDCMGIDSYRYVLLPRVLAALIALPLLTAMFNVIGIGGGYVIGVLIMGLSEGAYIQGLMGTVIWSDVYMGFIKSEVFAAVIIGVSLAKGYYPPSDRNVSGSEAVSLVTTEAVVLSAILMLFADYLISALML